MSLNKIERRERIKMRIRKIVSGTAFTASHDCIS